MRFPAAISLCLLTCPTLLGSCSPSVPATHFVVPQIDLVPCVGWTGGTPQSQKQLGDALAASLHAKECDERKMIAGAQILAGVPR